MAIGFYGGRERESDKNGINTLRTELGIWFLWVDDKQFIDETS